MSRLLDSAGISAQDEGYFDALVRMFEQALKAANALPARDGLFARLNCVREISHAFGYGVGDDMDFLFAKNTRCSSSWNRDLQRSQ